MTIARIYRPAKNAMQSGLAGIKSWVLDFEPSEPRQVEPLMGWTSSGDTRLQVRLRFDSKDEAIAYAARAGLAYRVETPKPSSRKFVSYSDNFRPGRPTPWSH